MTETYEKTINEETDYNCTMKFTSKGSDEGVTLSYEFSHLFEDDYEGELPAAYLAMRDTAIMLTRAIGIMNNVEDDTDEKRQAILELGDGLTENNETKH
jgi:hypothetical protein